MAQTILPRKIRPPKFRPNVPLRVNWKNPLTKGLISLVVIDNLGKPRDLVMRRPYDDVVGSPVILHDRLGKVVNLDGVNYGFRMLNSGLSFTEGSVLWYGELVSNGSNDGRMTGITYSSDTLESPYVSIGFSRTTTGDLRFQTNNGTTIQTIDTTLSVIQDVHCFLGTAKAGDQRVYENGAQINSASVSGNIAQGSNPFICVGADYTGGSRNPGAQFAIHAYWDRALTPGEARSASLDPGQLFEEAIQTTSFFPSSGTTIPVTTYSLAITENPVGIDRSIPVSTASLTVTENTVGIDRTIPVSTDILTITEDDVGIDRAIPVSTDALTVGEGTVNVQFGTVIPVTTDSLTITENTVTVQTGIPVTTDSLTISEGTVTVVFGTIIPVTTDNLSITENTVGIDRLIPLSTDGLTITENNVTIQINVPVTTDSLIINEGTVTVNFTGGNNIPVTTAALTITEGTVNVITPSTTAFWLGSMF